MSCILCSRLDSYLLRKSWRVEFCRDIASEMRTEEELERNSREAGWESGDVEELLSRCKE